MTVIHFGKKSTLNSPNQESSIREEVANHKFNFSRSLTDQNRGANLIKKRKTSVKFGIKASFLRFGMRTRMKYLIELKIFKLMVILIVLITGVLPHTTEDHLDVVYGLAEIQRNEQFYIIISNKESSIHEYVEMITADLSSQIKLVT